MQSVSAIDLKIGGLVPLTTTDLPAQLSAVVFCQGCPWQCRYCHNPHLIPRSSNEMIAWSDIINFLTHRIGLLDGVVFSGGEPTMQKALPQAIRKVTELGYKVGLHTAGQFPSVLEEVLPDLSWAGMDIKATPGRYQEITGRQIRWESILTSVRLIIESGIDHEFRTTFHPSLLSEKNIIDIAYMLSELGAKRFVLQGFRSNGCTDQALTSNGANVSIGMELYETLKLIFNDFEIRSFPNFTFTSH